MTTQDKVVIVNINLEILYLRAIRITNRKREGAI